MAAVVAVLGLAAYLGFVPSAGAISRQRAEQIALRALKPPKKGAGTRVTVAIFGLRAPLGAGAVVTEGGPKKAQGSRVRTTETVRPLGARTWLFWRDSKYGAMFSHPSVLLLIDDRSGKVTSRRRLNWWPLVNGRQPAFLRSEKNYLSKRYRIYSDLELAKRSAAPSTSALAAPAGPASVSDAPPGVFAKDCLLTLYNISDKRFLRDVKGMEEVATAAGIRSFRVQNLKGRPPNASDLRRATSQVIAAGCKDVLLYITAHGSESGFVLTGERVVRREKLPGGKVREIKEFGLISRAQLRRTIAAQAPNATFKVKVNTCHSGVQLPLIELPNVLIVETSSKSNEISFFYIPAALRGTLKNFYALPNTQNPQKRTEFTNRNVVGLQRFLERPDEIQHGLKETQAQNTSFLAWALSRAFTLGENADFASTLGWTDPQLRTKFAPSAP
jgi:hypothetical protein